VLRSCLWLAASVTALCASAASPEVSQLIIKFQAEPVFFKQQEFANEIARVAGPGDLSPLEPWLAHKDRHVRGNVAYLFAKLGDRRGLATIEGILTDDSPDRQVEWHGGSFIYSGDYAEAMAAYLRSPAALRAQIRVDRYYAVHLLGKLRDRRAVDTLIPLLDRDENNYNVAWALGEIGDARAISPLIVALSSPDTVVRVSAIHALDKLRAVRALPHLVSLFDDSSVPSAGERGTVGTAAAKAAVSIGVDVLLVVLLGSVATYAASLVLRRASVLRRSALDQVSTARSPPPYTAAVSLSARYFLPWTHPTQLARAGIVCARIGGYGAFAAIAGLLLLVIVVERST
jgi:HEAT repeat protein